MKTRSGFTLFELIVASSIIAVILAVAIPTFRFYQREAIRARASGDLSLLSAALRVYHAGQGNYPAPDDYQTELINSAPAVLESRRSDPFSDYADKPYVYKLSPNGQYYLLYSVGLLGDAALEISDEGKLSFVKGDPAVDQWASNGTP